MHFEESRHEFGQGNGNDNLSLKQRDGELVLSVKWWLCKSKTTQHDEDIDYETKKSRLP